MGSSELGGPQTLVRLFSPDYGPVEMIYILEEKLEDVFFTSGNPAAILLTIPQLRLINK